MTPKTFASWKNLIIIYFFEQERKGLLHFQKYYFVLKRQSAACAANLSNISKNEYFLVIKPITDSVIIGQIPDVIDN